MSRRRISPEEAIASGGSDADQSKALAVVAKFLTRYRAPDGGRLQCATCRGQTLLPMAFEVSQEYDTVADQESDYDVMNVVPKALVVCASCGHVMAFSWLIVQKNYG